MEFAMEFAKDKRKRAAMGRSCALASRTFRIGAALALALLLLGLMFRGLAVDAASASRGIGPEAAAFLGILALSAFATVAFGIGAATWLAGGTNVYGRRNEQLFWDGRCLEYVFKPQFLWQPYGRSVVSIIPAACDVRLEGGFIVFRGDIRHAWYVRYGEEPLLARSEMTPMAEEVPIGLYWEPDLAGMFSAR